MPLNIELCDVAANEQDRCLAVGQLQCPAVALYCDHGDVQGSRDRRMCHLRRATPDEVA
jgi:hypothetical protein